MNSMKFWSGNHIIIANCLLILSSVFLMNCGEKANTQSEPLSYSSDVELVVLGIAQDAGYPQMGCMKDCCKGLWKNPQHKKMVSCLGLVDHKAQKMWVFDATPDLKTQTKWLSDQLNPNQFKLPDGIFLTHGHIGHYTGLMYLGKESMGTSKVPVYAMPKMEKFLKTSGPWSQLVNIDNITLQSLSSDSIIVLSPDVSVIPVSVPHRGEYTETVGFKILGPEKKVLFIPDIDKWHLWEKSINEEIQEVDYAFLDGSFFKNGEVGNRDMSEIPHPFVEESMNTFDDLPLAERNKVHFIHFNHTNPLLKKESEAYSEVYSKGYKVAEEKSIIAL